MEIGQITISDMILTASSIIGGSWFVWFFVKRKTNTKNKLHKNKAGGDIAGGNIIKGGAQTKDNRAEISKHNNILKDNIASGDIAGGDIEK